MSYLILNNNLPIIQNIGQKNETFLFASTDSEELFTKSREVMGNDWYYYEKPIEYKYNSWGYRSKELDEIKGDFMIVFGCSYTEGIGLYEEDMWSTKVGKELGLEVLNMGMGGTSIDFQYYNTMLLFEHLLKINKLPKLVIYQWPFQYRTTFSFVSDYSKEGTSLGFELFCGAFPTEMYPANSKWYGQWYLHGFLENKGELIKQRDLYIKLSNIIWKSKDVKVLNWTFRCGFYEDTPNFLSDDFIVDEIVDEHGEVKARDLSHHGHLSQNLVLDYVLKKLNNGIS
jgi:hypothetical protein